MIAAGRLRETVTLQSPPAVDDGSGGQNGGWTTIATLRAAVEAMSGTEAVIAGAEISVVRYRVTIRRRALPAGLRLLWRGLVLDVRGTLLATDRSTLELICDAVPA